MTYFRNSVLGALICGWSALAIAQPAVTPTHRSAVLDWNEVALRAIEQAKPNQHQAVRMLAQLTLAQYAVIAQAAADEPLASAIGTASAQVIGSMFPSQGDFVVRQGRALQIEDSGFGRRVAQRILAHAQSDGFALPWSGSLPSGADAWSSRSTPPAPPAYPAIGGMRTFVIERGDASRPSAPPALGSERFNADLEELRRLGSAPTEEARRLAVFFDMTTGTMAGGYWNAEAAKSLRASGAGEEHSALVLATLNMAMMDALIACHDAKYVYWVPRPSQVDPSIQPLIGVPNHPSFPSNHACLSTAAGRVLAHFFPAESDRFARNASDAGRSRILGGIHYRFDVEAGEVIGERVAAAAITRHRQTLARLTGTVIGDSRR